MAYDGEWYPTEDGETIGRRGPEGGRVIADAELGDPDEPEDADARLTIEREDEGGFCVTAQLYGGWLYLTRRRGGEAEAEALAGALRAEMERLAALVPMEDDRDIAGRVRALNRAVAEVEARWTE